MGIGAVNKGEEIMNINYSELYGHKRRLRLHETPYLRRVSIGTKINRQIDISRSFCKEKTI